VWHSRPRLCVGRRALHTEPGRNPPQELPGLGIALGIGCVEGENGNAAWKPGHHDGRREAWAKIEDDAVNERKGKIDARLRWLGPRAYHQQAKVWFGSLKGCISFDDHGLLVLEGRQGSSQAICEGFRQRLEPDDFPTGGLHKAGRVLSGLCEGFVVLNNFERA
jgi:hypothetical protein